MTFHKLFMVAAVFAAAPCGIAALLSEAKQEVGTLLAAYDKDVASLAFGAYSTPMVRCSVGALRSNPEGYVWPLSNIRTFVGEAELIVQVRAVGLGPAQDLPPFREPIATSIQFEVMEVLKGDHPRAHLLVPGDSTALDDFNGGDVPYRIVRSGGQRGNCIATSYKLGAEYLLLLRANKDVFHPYWAPLAPLNEQVTGRDDAWVMWVRKQLR
jgi:hypothetical protein